MSERVIEPSEIILEHPNQPKENITLVNPWIRCIARFFDYSLFFLLLLITRKLFHGQLPFGKFERLIPFEFFVWIPIEALLLCTLGTTPGKFFLKTKLKWGKKNRLDFWTALRRSFAVWFRGLGMGIIGLNFFCLMIAYNKLKLFKITSWDRDDHIQVTHYPIGKWRLYLAVFVAVAGILYYYREKNNELQNVPGNVRSLHESTPSPRYAAGSHFSAQDSGIDRSYGK
jgi:hypothetical protein